MTAPSPSTASPVDPDKSGDRKGFRSWLRASLVAGIIVSAPLYVVFWVFNRIVLQVDGVLALVPRSIRDLTWTPPWAPAQIRFLETPGLGFVLTLLAILVVGSIARGFIGRRVVSWVESTLRAVPLLGAIYFAVRQLLEQVFSDRAQSFQKVVLVEFPRRDVYCLGFVTARAWTGVEDVVGRPLISVFVPTTPNPTSGFFVMFPEPDVKVLDMTVEEAFKALMSSGIVQPERGGILAGTSPLEVTQEIEPDRGDVPE
jgi:uncharacterized membrane protein